jgi:DNA polymerase-4
VLASREAKSVSVEDTFEQDISDRLQLEAIIERMARSVSGRLRKSGLSGRTVTLKMRHHDFETHTRSTTLAHPTDNARTLADKARGLLAGEDISNGLRLLGVGVSGLADWVQDDLFSSDDEATDVEVVEPDEAPELRPTRWYPGMDVHHESHGDGWVWGAGLGRVTVRFETRWTPPGPVHTFRADDPSLLAGHSGTFQT